MKHLVVFESFLYFPVSHERLDMWIISDRLPNLFIHLVAPLCSVPILLVVNQSKKVGKVHGACLYYESLVFAVACAPLKLAWSFP